MANHWIEEINKNQTNDQTLRQVCKFIVLFWHIVHY